MATLGCWAMMSWCPRLLWFQEFCLFAVVGLVSDFFLQMLFFTTVLSIDIRRMEVGMGQALPWPPSGIPG